MSNIQRNFGIKTYFKFFSVNPKTLKETPLSDWSGNTILTSGRNELSKRDWFTAVQVGTSSVLPHPSQTALQAYVAGSTTVVSSSSGSSSSAPYYAYRRKTFRITSGIANENLNEVALGWSATTSTSIMARALITDIDGNQVTVTPLPGEWLDILVEVRYYPGEDITGTVDVMGETYDYIFRASSVTNNLLWADYIGSQILAVCTSNGDWYATDGDIGTILTGPSGLSASCDNHAEWNGAYSENSYQRKIGITGGANAWNLLTGKYLRSLRIRSTAGAFQVQFDSHTNPGFGIPKTNLHQLGVGFTIAWGEATPVLLTNIGAQVWSVGIPVSIDVDSYFNAEKLPPTGWSISSGALPAGLSLNASTGEISGTPTTLSSGTFVIRCTNDAGYTDTDSVNWTVA